GLVRARAITGLVRTRALRTTGIARRVRRAAGVALAQAQLGRAGRPRTPTLTVENVLGDRDLLTARCLVGARSVLGAAEGLPGGGGELEATVVAVAGIDRPVAAGLAFGQLVPGAVTGRCCRAGNTERQRDADGCRGSYAGPTLGEAPSWCGTSTRVTRNIGHGLNLSGAPGFWPIPPPDHPCRIANSPGRGWSRTTTGACIQRRQYAQQQIRYKSISVRLQFYNLPPVILDLIRRGELVDRVEADRFPTR